LKKHGPALVIGALALGILYLEFRAVPFYTRMEPIAFENPFFVAVGKWAIRFLLLSLAITPLYAFTGWRPLNRLRKPMGLAAFLFVAVHAGLYVFYKGGMYTDERALWQRLTEPTFVIYGVIAFIILALLTATSIKPTMRLMGRYWKPLHRLVYVAGLMMMLHSITAATSGKRPFMPGGVESANELKVYLAVLAVLLALRVPFIEYSLKRLLPFDYDLRKSKRKRAMLMTE
jgi:sulfoxide reductase heme-binding subunit YedZ